MLLANLIRPGQECRVRHPEIGEVLWTGRIWKATAGAWGLVWATGSSRGRALIADESVLLDDRWEAVPSPPVEDDVEQLLRAKVPPAAGVVGDPAAVTSRNQLWDFIDKLESNPLDDPQLWEKSAGDLLHALGQALGGMPSYPPEDRSDIDPNTASWSLFAWVLENARDLVRM